MHLTNRLSTFSTARAPIESRISLWEDHNRDALISLRVASFARESISSTMMTLPLESMKLTAIRGNDHVIERSDSLVKHQPADTIMFCLLNKGDAFFYGPQGVDGLVGSEAILYDPDTPFMYGFKSSMEQFIFEIPRADFHRLTGMERLEEPIFFGSQDSLMLGTSRRIFVSAMNAIREGRKVAPQRVEEIFGDVFRQLVTPESGEAENAYYMAARDFISSHAHLSSLSVGDVANAVGISDRHLGRVFSTHGLSVGKYIADVRLDLAHKLLTEDRSRKLTIGQIAKKVGFVHASHFSRAFKARFDGTPRDIRERYSKTNG